MVAICTPSAAEFARTRTLLTDLLAGAESHMAALPFVSAERVLNFLKELSCNAPSVAAWTKLRLSTRDFILFQEFLQPDGLVWECFREKPRIDFDPIGSSVTFRAPTTLHNAFVYFVSAHIDGQLRAIAASPGNLDAELAGAVKWGGPTNVQLQPDSHTRAPDACFKGPGAEVPALVIEASYPQKREDMPFAAFDFITGSEGDVKMVVVFDIEHKNTKMATVSVWEHRVELKGEALQTRCKKVLEDKMFRGKDSTPANTDATLDIFLEIFRLPGAAMQPQGTKIQLSYATLHRLLGEAERCHRVGLLGSPCLIETSAPKVDLGGPSTTTGALNSAARATHSHRRRRRRARRNRTDAEAEEILIGLDLEA
ncbi:MAG: hypothetical protein M1829_001614 [Trizodia sp. TS-e1964]|nr:MAG: hypothetical protein M1829_001614 [Trizodia sp. TS-e1964]